MRICIVEDEPIIAEEIKMHLSNLGHEVMGVFHEAKECLEQLETLNPELMFLDIDLGKGEIDGVSLAHLINSEFKIPFIFLTAYYDDATLQRASMAKPKAYLLKPFEKNDLKVTLAMLSLKHLKPMNTGSTDESEKQRLYVKDKNGFMNPLLVADICYFQACDNYCYIFTEKERFLVLQRLKDFVMGYQHVGFRQVHRSYAVNLITWLYDSD
ncbi:MAG: response regulator [Bacteroidota bacterium]